MRIAILSIHSSPVGRAGERDTGGMSTYLRGLSRALADAGHEVDLFTRKQDPAEETVRELAPGVRLVCPDDGLGFLAKEEIYLYSEKIVASIEDFRRRENTRYHLIFSHYWLSAWIGELLKSKWKLSHLVMFHTIGRAKNELCPSEKEPVLRLEKEEMLAKKCDHLITASTKEKENLVYYFNLSSGKITAIPCGIDRGLFRPFGASEKLEAKKQIGYGVDEKILFAVGRSEPVKGFDLLIKAASLLPSEDNFRVVLAGGDPGKDKLLKDLQKSALDLDLADRVSFTGTMPHERLPLYYNAADITVIPSFYESFALVALESLACGTGVVASPVGIIPELLTWTEKNGCGPLGCLVEGRSPEVWAAKIMEAVEKRERIDPGTITATLAPYNWEKAAAELIRQARRVIKSPPL